MYGIGRINNLDLNVLILKSYSSSSEEMKKKTAV